MKSAQSAMEAAGDTGAPADKSWFANHKNFKSARVSQWNSVRAPEHDEQSEELESDDELWTRAPDFEARKEEQVEGQQAADALTRRLALRARLSGKGGDRETPTRDAFSRLGLSLWKGQNGLRKGSRARSHWEGPTADSASHRRRERRTLEDRIHEEHLDSSGPKVRGGRGV
eukprot:TRINITY_DN8592_c1_g2_i1.p1 TRINITY_DN8592_c1_g2~~TRINITY_DN8592_c1_g2_i1.p1  ORF type:complete len:172 (+),score=23.66 TRINITY_DN8592_c1_g2_i1:187-702(+)